ncbi:MAG: hypothetical protein KDC53_03370 [Saprospiraceae bacterium]|nr:hypothetical protein [Saprospiraceae bacterium]
MLTQNNASIFLADRRVGSPFVKVTDPEGFKVIDHFMSPGESPLTLDMQSGPRIIYPFIGDLKIQSKDELVLQEDQLMVLPQGVEDFSVVNPYAGDAINFFEIFIPGNTPLTKPVIEDLTAYDHGLLSLPGNTFIGKFAGRQEVSLDIRLGEEKVFVYVISGAFEAQYCLLETRDALVLHDLDVLEIEALSNDAVLLVQKLMI